MAFYRILVDFPFVAQQDSYLSTVVCVNENGKQDVDDVEDNLLSSTVTILNEDLSYLYESHLISLFSSLQRWQHHGSLNLFKCTSTGNSSSPLIQLSSMHIVCLIAVPSSLSHEELHALLRPRGKTLQCDICVIRDELQFRIMIIVRFPDQNEAQEFWSFCHGRRFCWNQVIFPLIIVLPHTTHMHRHFLDDFCICSLGDIWWYWFISLWIIIYQCALVVICLN